MSRNIGAVAVGHPVDVASGVFFDTLTDYAVTGAVPLALERHYSTRLLEAAPLGSTTSSGPTLPFGPGFRAGFAAELRRTLDGFSYTTAKGDVVALPTPAQWTMAPGARVLSPGDALELQVLDGGYVRLVGFASGRSRHSLVFAPRASTLDYDLVSIERTAHARLDVTRDASGRVVRLLQTRERKALDLHYDASRIVAADLVLASGRARRLVEYAYDAAGLLREVRDRNGVREAYVYDGAGRMIQKESRGAATYTIRYDHAGRCVYVSGSDGYQERTLHYDVPGRRTTVRNSHGESTTYDWNERGQVVRVTSPLGHQVTSEYDDEGRLIREVVPNGSTITHVYDALGRRIERMLPGGVTERYTYDAEHRLSTFEDNARSLAVRYDAHGGVAALASDGDPPWHYERNEFGECVRLVNPLGASRSFVRDALGNVVEEVDFGGAVFRHAYDEAGQVVATVDALGRVRRFEYDEDGSPTAYVAPDGAVFRRSYDAVQRVQTTTGPEGRVETTRFNVCGKPVEIEDETGLVTRLEWGTEPGELLAIVNTRGERCELRRDAEGRVVRQRMFDGRELTFEYDAENLRAVVNASGQRIEYEYDERGNLVGRTTPEGASVYEYDDKSQLVRAATPESTMTLAYDPRGLCVEEIVDGVTVQRAYDLVGRPTALRTSLGDATDFLWTAGGEVSEIVRGALRIGFERDLLGREVRRHLPVGTFEQAYDAGGRIAFQGFRPAQGQPSRPYAVWRSLAYDGLGRPSRIADSLRGEVEYGHDGRGPLRSVLRAGGISELYAADGEGDRRLAAYSLQGHAYDAALATAGPNALGALANRYAFDVDAATFAPGSRLETWTSGSRSVTYEYDANGCVVRKTVTLPSGVREWRFSWSSIRQLTAATLPDGTTWTYRYDPCGRRIEKRAPDGSVQRFVWQANRILHVLVDGKRTESFVYLPGSTSPVLRETDSVQYALPDATGALSELVFPDGTVKASRKGVWGEGHIGADGTALQPLRSQWQDAETGLHYNLYRYYDPDTGRFLSPDPAGLAGGLNAYLAVVSPVAEADDWGLVRTGPTSFPGGADRTRGYSRETIVQTTNRSGDTVPTHRGGIRTEEGTVSLRGNTACDRFDNGVNPNNLDDPSRQPAYTTLNGRATPDDASMHAEMRAMARANGPDLEHLSQGEGPIVFVISRPPCSHCEVDLPPEAQRLANATGRPVHVYHPPYDEEIDVETGRRTRRPNMEFEPQCG